MTRKKTEGQDIEPVQSKDGSNIEPQAPAGNSPAKAAPTARSQGKGYALVAVVYLLGLCMGALDMGIVNPARTVIQNTLSVDDSLGVWIITIYTLAYAVSIPIMGKLADRHGRKGVYLLCILLFGIGSALCGVAQDLGNFWILIGARVIQALGGGGIMPVATAEFGTAFPEEKRGMALGIVGMGAIGKRLAVRAKAFEMDVMAYDPYFDEAFAAEHGIKRMELDDLLRAANVISLHVPLNDSTRHMIDAARIAEMQDGAIVINTARGGLIDEAAAAEAIRSGKLGGLGLDAFEQEPLVDSPLKNLPHVIFTPHTGAHTGEAVAKMGMMSVENAIAVLKGEPCRFILK